MGLRSGRVVVAYPAYLRDRARELRVEKKLSIDEIAARLALPKTTVYYWIRDRPLGRARRESTGQRKGSGATRANYRRRRETAYAEGVADYDDLMQLPTLRDFVALYIAEGYKRRLHTASICNSDPTIVALAAGWLRRLSGKSPIIRVQYHADQDVETHRAFWATITGVDPCGIRLLPKSNRRRLANSRLALRARRRVSRRA